MTQLGMSVCKACGDLFSETSRRIYLFRAGWEPKKGELDYCKDCANELFRDIINTSPAQLYSAGFGNPAAEFNDCDGGPMREINVRRAEDG